MIPAGVNNFPTPVPAGLSPLLCIATQVNHPGRLPMVCLGFTGNAFDLLKVVTLGVLKITLTPACLCLWGLLVVVCFCGGKGSVM